MAPQIIPLTLLFYVPPPPEVGIHTIALFIKLYKALFLLVWVVVVFIWTVQLGLVQLYIVNCRTIMQITVTIIIYIKSYEDKLWMRSDQNVK